MWSAEILLLIGLAPGIRPATTRPDMHGQTSCLQVRDPHSCDYAPVIKCLLLCVLVAGPDEIFLGRKGLAFLFNPKLPFSDVTNHGIHHRGSGSFRSRLHDDVTHRDGLETRDEGRSLALVSTLHDTPGNGVVSVKFVV